MKKGKFMEKYIAGESLFTFWNFAGRGISFLNTLIILNYLSLYQYGVFQLILSLYSTALDFVSIGGGAVNNEISRSIAAKNEPKAKKLFYEYGALRLGAGIILWAVFFFGANLFASVYSQGFVNEIRIISFLFIVDVVYTSVRSLLSIRLRFHAVAASGSVYRFVQLAVLCAYLLADKVSIGHVVISMIAGTIGSTIFLLYSFIKVSRLWESVAMAPERVTLILFSGYAKWDVLRQLFGKFANRLQPWLVKIFISTEAVAIFSIVTSLISVLKDVAFPTRTLQSLVPLYLDDKEKSQKIFTYGIKYLTLFSLVVGLAGLFFFPLIIHTFFPKYSVALPYFKVMLFTLPITAVGIMLGVFFIALRKQKYLFLYSIIRSAGTIIFSLILFPLFGIWGMVAEALLTPFLLLFVHCIYIEKIRPGVRIKLGELLRLGADDKAYFFQMFGHVTDAFKKHFSKLSILLK